MECVYVEVSCRNHRNGRQQSRAAIWSVQHDPSYRSDFYHLYICLRSCELLSLPVVDMFFFPCKKEK